MPTECRVPSPLTGWPGLLASLLLALVIHGITAARTPVIAKDGMLFIRMARMLETSPMETMRAADQHPGYPAMVLAAHRVTRMWNGDPVFAWIDAARWVSGAMGLLCVLLVWRMTRKLFGPEAATMAAMLFAAHPLFSGNASDAVSDTPHLFFYLLSAGLALEGFSRRSVGWFAGAGIAGGAAYWIRPEGLCPVVAAGGVLLALLAFQRGDRLRRAGALTAIIAAAVLMVMPYALIKGELTTKKPLPFFSQEGNTATAPSSAQPVSSVSPASTPTPAARPLESRLHDIIRAVAAASVRTLHGFRFILLLPLGVALCTALRQRPSAEARRYLAGLASLHFILLIYVFIIAGYVSVRHVMPIIAIAMPWIGAGTWHIVMRAKALLPRRNALPRHFPSESALIAIGFLLALPMLPRTLAPMHRHRAPFVEAGIALRSLARPGDAVLSNSPYVAFYADLPGNDPAYHSVNSAMDSLDRARSEYRFIVLDAGERFFEPQWLDILAPHYRPLQIARRDSAWKRLIVLVRKAPAPPA